MVVLFILLKILIYFLIVILSIMLVSMLAILLIPFNYFCSGRKLESSFLEGHFSWLFGGLKMKFNYSSEEGPAMAVSFFGFKKSIKDFKKNTKFINKFKNNTKAKKKGEKPAYSYFTYDVIKKIIEKVLKIIDHCKPKKFQLDVSGGFGEPMYTGLLYAIKSTGFIILDKYNVSIQPKFEEDEIKGSFIIGGSIHIGYLILVMIEFMTTKPFKSILAKNIKFKIKRRLKKWQGTSVSMRA